jgi:cytochrome c-type biogenesis protein CcmE
MDVTPREAPPVAPKRRALGWGLGIVLVAAVGFLLFKGLTEASVFFLNVDEAVERQDELGSDRFRIQGYIVSDSVATEGEYVDFQLTYAGETAQIRHHGNPAEVLHPETPVVLEGAWNGDRFESDLLLNKHDEVYEEENPERLEYDPDQPPIQEQSSEVPAPEAAAAETDS